MGFIGFLQYKRVVPIMKKDSVLCEVGTKPLCIVHYTMWNTVSFVKPKGVKYFTNLLLYYLGVDAKMLLKRIFKK